MTGKRTITKTLSTTVADAITVGHGGAVWVVNHDATQPLFVQVGEGAAATVAVADADNAIPIPAGRSVRIELPGVNAFLSVVGSGNRYSIVAGPVTYV
jgi:hypothetical protein